MADKGLEDIDAGKSHTARARLAHITWRAAADGQKNFEAAAGQLVRAGDTTIA